MVGTTWRQKHETIMREPKRKTKGSDRKSSPVAECLRRLHPARQWKEGIAFFQYLAALITSGATIGLWMTGRPQALEGLVLSILLWSSVLCGNWLAAVLDIDSTTDEFRRELQRLKDRDQERPGGRTAPDEKSGTTHN